MLQEIKDKLNNPWREKIQFFDTITSTNDVLKQLALQGAPEGTTLVADCQTGGRGRMGRTFLSPSGVGIYLSVLLRPNCKPTELMHLTCASASAACSAIEQTSGFRPGVKWTNDIVYNKRKLAGILTELGLNQDGTTGYAIIGIGFNCNQQLRDFPPAIQDVAGSLKMVTGKETDRALLAAKMIEALYQMNRELLSDRAGILARYRQDCITLRQEISLVRGDEIRHGKALDVDENGALVVRYEDDTIEAVNSGEVSVRGMYHYV